MAVFSIFRFALAHKLRRHRAPLAHQSRHLHPPAPSFDSFSPVSPFEYEVALGWLPENKLLGEQGLAKLFTRVGILIEEYAQLSCAKRFDNHSHPSHRSFPDLFTRYNVHHVIACQKSRLHKSFWIFISDVDNHCLNTHLQNSLANTLARN